MVENEISILKVSVHSFHEKYIDSKTVTFFNMDINISSKNQWTLEKRYTDFKTMNDILIKIYPNVPFLPGITLFKVTSFEELTKRRIELEEYLRECIKRKDIFRSIYLQRFFELEKHCPQVIGNSIEKICELPKLQFSVRDFIFSPNDSVLFVCMSDNNTISRLDSMFTNFTFFWEEKSSCPVPLGSICIYRVSPNVDKNISSNEYAFNKVWSTSFGSQAAKINYEPISQMLSAGLDDGKVYLYKHTPGMHFIDFREVLCKPVHTDKIVGIAYDKETNCIYSCSADKTFCATDVNSKVTTPIGRSYFAYTNMKYDQKNERLFITNEVGQLKVFLTTIFPPVEVLQLQTSAMMPIRALTVDIVHTYIFTGTQTGKICILNLGLPGKERFITELSSFGGEAGLQITAICYNSNKHELITGDEQGRVSIWSLRTGKLQYVWLAHPDCSITQMHLDVDYQALWTTGTDLVIYVWKFPETWNSPLVEDFEQNQVHVISENMALARIQKALLKSQENEEEESDSSDDDLNGWEH